MLALGDLLLQPELLKDLHYFADSGLSAHLSCATVFANHFTFLQSGLPDCSWYGHQKREKIYQITINYQMYIKWPNILPNGQKLFPTAVK
jgi:hypothetical protein